MTPELFDINAVPAELRPYLDEKALRAAVRSALEKRVAAILDDTLDGILRTKATDMATKAVERLAAVALLANLHVDQPNTPIRSQVLTAIEGTNALLAELSHQPNPNNTNTKDPA